MEANERTINNAATIFYKQVDKIRQAIDNCVEILH
jgi:hypothetical protein